MLQTIFKKNVNFIYIMLTNRILRFNTKQKNSWIRSFLEHIILFVKDMFNFDPNKLKTKK